MTVLARGVLYGGRPVAYVVSGGHLVDLAKVGPVMSIGMITEADLVIIILSDGFYVWKSRLGLVGIQRHISSCAVWDVINRARNHDR